MGVERRNPAVPCMYVILLYFMHQSELSKILPTFDEWSSRQRSVSCLLSLHPLIFSQMLGNLQNPPEPFADIIRTHFRLKARSIAAQLDQWLSQDDGRQTLGDGGGPPGGKADSPGQSSNGLASDVAEMKRLLKEMQAGFGTSRRT